MTTAPFAHVVSGSPYRLGFEHGTLLRSRIQQLAVAPFGLPTSTGDRTRWHSELRAHLEVLRDETPDLVDELAGLAAGAEIAFEDALLLQYRRELQSSDGGGCTTFATVAQDDCVVAQTIDLEPLMRDLCVVVRLRPERGPEALMVGFAGLLGFVGMNAAGLAVGLNFVKSAGWKPGVSPYLIVRRLLALDSIDDCIREISRLSRSSSRAFTITDGSRVACVETTPRSMAVLDGPELVRANHYLHPALAAEEAMNVFSRNASKRRQARLEELASASPRTLNSDGLFSWLADHSLFPVGICAHSDRPSREETVAGVVMRPRERLLQVRQGHVCTAETFDFRLD